MSSICGEIDDNILHNCDNLPVGGVKSKLRLINFDDIASVTYDVENPLIVTGITLKAGKFAYTYEVFRRGHKPRVTKVNGDNGDRYRHEIDSSIQVWTNASKRQVMGLNGGQFVAIAENLQNMGDARIEIYGLAAGLYVADGAVRNLVENDGVYTFTLASDDASLEPKIPHTFGVLTAGVYSYTDSIEALEALDKPGV